MATTVQHAPGLWRIDLQHSELGVPGREVIQNRVEIRPEAPCVRPSTHVSLRDSLEGSPELGKEACT